MNRKNAAGRPSSAPRSRRIAGKAAATAKATRVTTGIKTRAGSTGNSKPNRKPAKVPASTGPSADPALRRARAAIRNLKAELAEANARIDKLQAWADTDFLLDIFNRRGFERELARALAYIRRYDATGALIVLDVDRLKPINDAFGHAAGDAVLKGIVAVLMRHVRSSDIVGRLGGDEFGLLLWNLNEANALAKAAALEDAIDRLTFVFRGQSTAAGASAGVAMLTVQSEPEVVLEQADRAMYARKLARKGAVAAAVALRR